MNGRIVALSYFPIKGLSAHPLDSVRLEVGAGFPGDRQWGFARPDSGFDPADPKPLPKDKFVVLLKEAELAGVQAELQSDTLRMLYGGTQAGFDLRDASDRLRAADFLRDCLRLTEKPMLVRSDPHRFTDVSVVSQDLMTAVSILSRSSVADFAARIDRPVETGRFRMNVEIEGWTPWRELDHVGRDIELGEARLKVLLRTKRCAATEVNPATATRDIPLPRLLRQVMGHLDMGVYAQVTQAGKVRLGDKARLL